LRVIFTLRFPDGSLRHVLDGDSAGPAKAGVETAALAASHAASPHTNVFT
jgi:hypothetical protein